MLLGACEQSNKACQVHRGLWRRHRDRRLSVSTPKGRNRSMTAKPVTLAPGPPVHPPLGRSMGSHGHRVDMTLRFKNNFETPNVAELKFPLCPTMVPLSGLGRRPLDIEGRHVDQTVVNALDISIRNRSPHAVRHSVLRRVLPETK